MQLVQERRWPTMMQKRVLVVDDDLYTREGLRVSLLRAGYCVETAADGWQAFKKIKEETFEVGIVDLNLPAVNGVPVSGWDLVRIFRAFQPAIVIIVVSADTGKEIEAQVKLLEVPAFLEKPIDPSQLKAIVRTLTR